MVTVTISYRILDSYSESACAIQGLGVSSACAACGHVDSVDSVEGRTLEIRNVLILGALWCMTAELNEMVQYLINKIMILHTLIPISDDLKWWVVAWYFLKKA